MVKITVRTSARVHAYPTDTVLPADGFLPSADAVKTTSARMRQCVRADVGRLRVCTSAHPCGHNFRGGQIRVLLIKGGALPLFPHFQPIPVE
jgi:hypothetical protein